MAPGLSRALRALLGLPLLGLAVLCFRAMDPEKLVAHQQPFLKSGLIEYDGHSLPILKRFHYVEFLDEVWRGTTATFSPSTLGYDGISSWQMFSFLNDLGPVYAVWFLESCRVGNRFTPAYLSLQLTQIPDSPTIFSFAAQLLGIGSVAPVLYFLSFVFGPSPSELSHSARDRELRTGNILFLLPIILALHTSEVFGAYCSPTPETRHYWTWAWQMAPLWIGVLNFIAARLSSAVPSLKTLRTSSSPTTLLAVLGSISSAVWIYTLTSSPHSISELFVPDKEAQFDFILHTRQALQSDEVYVFAGSFLWLLYSLLDLHTSGVAGRKFIVPVVLLPITAACLGPGSAFSLGWYWREALLQASETKVSK
ncbi:hypothetical protein diail_6075 [Diaporthe ilicicola]|nr:hypothetical protein diail_6075 [Diaporthe ilicicola]